MTGCELLTEDLLDAILDSGEKFAENGAASVDYTMFSGYVSLAYMWTQMAELAQLNIAEGAEPGFYRAKIATAGAASVMDLDEVLLHG